MKRTLLLAVIALLIPLFASAQWNLMHGYRSFYEAGVNIGTANASKTNFEISTSQGYQLVPTYFYIGTEAAFQAFFNADGACGFPVFVNLRTNFSPSGASPFLDVRVGYASVTNSDWYDNGGFYLNPSLGLRIALSRSIGLNIRGGYTWQYAKVYTTSVGDFNVRRENRNIGGATIMVGVEF